MINLVTIRRKILPLLWVALGTMSCADDELFSLAGKTDEFIQNTAAKVDILWIVDNSGSMAEEQTGLGESFQAFIDNLLISGVDFHIGVISTDIADGGKLHTGPSMPPFIDPSTSNAAQAFLENVKVGTTGSALEKGFEAAALAMGKGIGQWVPGDPEPVPVPNPNFLRRGYCVSSRCEGTQDSCANNSECDQAALFLTFVSDEDDKSFGPVRYYWRLFESLKSAGNESLVKISAIVGFNSEEGIASRCFNAGRGSAQPGDRYVSLVVQAGGTSATDGSAQGIVTSICEDFNASLTALSINAAGLKQVFPLGSLPNLAARIPCETTTKAPFCVRVNGEAIPEDTQNTSRGWTFVPEQNAIFFGAQSLPPPQAKITVTYQENRLGGVQP